VIGRDDGAQVLDIEPGRQRGRPDEVAEHDGQMTAFGLGLWFGTGTRVGARKLGDARQ
jgi:hypothetical protein